MESPRIDLSCQTLAVTFTGPDVRQPLFRYYHELEASSDHELGCSHGQPLVLKQPADAYYVTLTFPDLPDIYCLDERHGRFQGIPLEAAVAGAPQRAREITFQWLHEHFITATWTGVMVPEFEPLWRRLLEILGPPWAGLRITQGSQPYGTPDDLARVGRFLSTWPNGGDSTPVT